MFRNLFLVICLVCLAFGRISALASEAPASAKRLSAANEKLWTAEFVRYGKDKDGWVIHPAVAPVPAANLTNLLAEIRSKDKNAQLQHLALGSLSERGDIQSDVLSFLQTQELFQKSPPPFGKNEWNFKNNGAIQKLVAAGILQSPFAKELDAQLELFGWKISSAVMEKLYFTKEDGHVKWHAIVWLNFGKADQANLK